MAVRTWRGEQEAAESTFSRKTSSFLEGRHSWEWMKYVSSRVRGWSGRKTKSVGFSSGRVCHNEPWRVLGPEDFTVEWLFFRLFLLHQSLCLASICCYYSSWFPRTCWSQSISSIDGSNVFKNNKVKRRNWRKKLKFSSWQEKATSLIVAATKTRNPRAWQGAPENCVELGIEKPQEDRDRDDDEDGVLASSGKWTERENYGFGRNNQHIMQ